MVRADDLRGMLIATVPVAFGADGRVHAEAQGRYVAHMAGQPVGGVALWTQTGRGLRITAEQRGEVLAAWRDGLVPPRLVIAAAGGTHGLRRPDEVFASAVAMARQAAELRADALLVHPPVAFRGHRDQDRLILEFHAAVAEAGLPLILSYLYQTAGGIAYGPHVLAQLLARPDVLGLTVATLDSVMTFQQVARLVRERFPDKVLITGEERFLGYSLMCGAEAAMIGLGAACPGLPSDLLRSHRPGDASRFLALNGLVDELARHTFVPPMEGSSLRLLWCLVHQGVIPAEAAHDPFGPGLAPAEIEAIRLCLGRLAGGTNQWGAEGQG
jgi:4-hydroxy-tetrahydrodipicolinate synthase